MRNQSFLRCLIIVRTHQQKSVCSILFCLLRQIYRSLGTIRTSACNHRNPLRHFLDCKTDYFQMFFMRQRRRFSGSSTDNDTVCSIGNLKFQKLCKLRIIHRTRLRHRSYNRNSRACKNRHNFPLLKFFCPNDLKSKTFSADCRIPALHSSRNSGLLSAGINKRRAKCTPLQNLNIIK